MSVPIEPKLLFLASYWFHGGNTVETVRDSAQLLSYPIDVDEQGLQSWI